MRRITNVRIPTPLSNKSLLWSVYLDSQDVISAIEPIDVGSAYAGEDFEGDWLSPMGLDLQINGLDQVEQVPLEKSIRILSALRRKAEKQGY